jgi:hypothetical protein
MNGLKLRERFGESCGVGMLFQDFFQVINRALSMLSLSHLLFAFLNNLQCFFFSLTLRLNPLFIQNRGLKSPQQFFTAKVYK